MMERNRGVNSSRPRYCGGRSAGAGVTLMSLRNFLHGGWRRRVVANSVGVYAGRCSVAAGDTGQRPGVCLGCAKGRRETARARVTWHDSDYDDASGGVHRMQQGGEAHTLAVRDGGAVCAKLRRVVEKGGEKESCICVTWPH